MLIFICFALIVLGFYTLLLGLRGAITRKPFLYRSRNAFWIYALAFAPTAVLPLHWSWISSAEHSEGIEWSSALPFLLPALATYLALLFLYYRALNGYTIIGVTDDSLRQALYDVLEDLRLPFEGRLPKLRLISLGTDLEARVNALTGAASLRVEGREHRKILEQIAAGLRNRFDASPVGVNIPACAFFIVTGVLILAIAGIFGYVLTSGKLI